MCHLYSVKFTGFNHFVVSAVFVTSLLFIETVDALNLQQAENLAIQADPEIERYKATSQSHLDEAVADNTLPDPKLRVGAVNVPVDSFKLDQEQMTQLKIGIQQNFPRGNVRKIKQQQSQFLSHSAESSAADTKLKIIKDVRETYLNIFYTVSAYQIIRETRSLFSELVKITESNYAVGRVNQQDVILAGLELARLDDRSTKIQANEEGYRTQLAQWIGDVAWSSISPDFPFLPALPEQVDLNKIISRHPLIQSEDAKVNASEQMIELAKQEYKPGLSLLFDYGYRSGDNPDGSERSDFASAVVSLDIPLFTANRQDKTLSSNKKKVAAARFAKDEQLRKIKQFYEKNHYNWQRLGDREELYKTSLLKAATNNSQASLKAYQSGVSEFNTLMRAQITELEVRLEDLRVRVDRAIAKARLLYIIGESDNENR